MNNGESNKSFLFYETTKNTPYLVTGICSVYVVRLPYVFRWYLSWVKTSKTCQPLRFDVKLCWPRLCNHIQPNTARKTALWAPLILLGLFTWIWQRCQRACSASLSLCNILLDSPSENKEKTCFNRIKCQSTFILSYFINIPLAKLPRPMSRLGKLVGKIMKISRCVYSFMIRETIKRLQLFPFSHVTLSIWNKSCFRTKLQIWYE